MVCGTCGATSGEFATRTRCMDCQRQIWRDNHAARMGDPVRAEARRQNLAEYHRKRPSRAVNPEPPGSRAPAARGDWLK